MTYDSPLTLIIFILLLIGIPAGYYFSRPKQDTRKSKGPPGSKADNMPGRFKKWFADTFPSPSRSIRKTSRMVVESEGKPVEVEVSADLPEGTAVDVTLKVVDSRGRSRSQKETLAHRVVTPTRTATQKSSARKGVRGKPARPVKQKRPGKRRPSFIATIRGMGVKGVVRWGVQPENRGWTLLAGAVLVYALIISIGIEHFPIYFFTDEAIHMNMISDFIRDGYRNYDKEFLPTFFIAEGWVNGTSVYVQWLPYLLFGKSIIVTRLVSAFITLLGALAMGLLLKQVFRIKYHWTAVFLLLTTPAWFLHARTAFEYAEVASFFMIFLYFYGRYRDGHMPSLYFAIVAGSLAFYSHGLGQVLMGVTGLALAVVDFKYHIHPDRRRTVLFGFALALLLLLPFARYYLVHSDQIGSQIKRRGSYWYDGNLTTPEKVLEFIRQYAYGLNPLYWYFRNPIDIARHVMKDYGNGLLITLPFALVGFIKIITSLRRFAYRIVLIAFLAAPVPASIVAVGMPRMLWMCIPMAMITAIGLSVCLEQLEAYWKRSSSRLPVVTFVLLTTLSVFMLRDALVNGPLWFEEYGLYGMQFGAKQVFADTIVPELEKDPNLVFVVSPSWANGTDEFADFFIPRDVHSQVRFGQPVNSAADPAGITPNMRFIVTSNEYDALIENAKFTDITVHKTILHPNGKPGFYLITLKLADNIDEIIAAEKVKNRTPVEDVMQLNGQEVRTLHSPFDAGELKNVFDDNPDTLAKVLEANPLVFDLYLPTPIDTRSAVIQTGSLPDFTVTISLYEPGADVPVTYTETFVNLPPDPLVTMNFGDGPSKSARIYIEIKDNLSGETSQIHIRTIQFK
jgi:hypothetical protein